MMQSLVYNWTLFQGVGPATGSFLAGEDVTGFSASMKFRKTLTGTADLTLSGGAGVTIGGADGAFSVSISIANIATLVTAWISGTATSANGVYDLIFTRGDGTTALALTGQVALSLTSSGH